MHLWQGLWKAKAAHFPASQVRILLKHSLREIQGTIWPLMSRQHPLESLDPKALPWLWEEMALSCSDVTQEDKGSVATPRDVSSGLWAPFHSSNPCCWADRAHWDGLDPIQFLNSSIPEQKSHGLCPVSCARKKINLGAVTIPAWGGSARRVFPQAWPAWNIPWFRNIYSQIHKFPLFWVATTYSSGHAQDLLTSRSDFSLTAKYYWSFCFNCSSFWGFCALDNRI